MATKREGTNPLTLLWRRHPWLMAALCAGLLGFAAVTNPPFLRWVGLIAYTLPIPKSGFWVSSGMAASIACLALLARRRAWAARASVGLTSLAVVLIIADTCLRMASPIEVTEASTAPKIKKRNSWGFRDTEPRPTAQTRVLVLGDSITYAMGDHLTRKNRYHDLVERRLLTEGLDVDVQNVSKPGWNFPHYLRHFRELAPDYRPHLVIVGWCVNDLNYGEAARRAAPPKPRVLGSRGATTAITQLAWKLHVNEWYLWTVLCKRVSLVLKRTGAAETDWLDKHDSTYTLAMQDRWNDEQLLSQLSADLASFAGECRERDIRLMFAIFPTRTQVTRRLDDELETFRSILSRLDIPFVDLYTVYATRPEADDLFSYRDNIHLNRAGHAIAADAMFDRVLQLLRQPSSSQATVEPSTADRS